MTLFQLSKKEAESSLLQFARAKAKAARSGRQTPPYAFTEQGVAVLSPVLKSQRSIHVTTVIMTGFAVCVKATVVWQKNDWMSPGTHRG